jgi:hypothetical protein
MIRNFGLAYDSYIYAKKDVDGKLIFSSKSFDGSNCLQLIGSGEYYVICLNQLLSPYEEQCVKYTVVFEDGYYIFTPYVYPNEVGLFYKGNGVLLDMNIFHNKLRKEEVDGKICVYVCVDEDKHVIKLFK